MPDEEKLDLEVTRGMLEDMLLRAIEGGRPLPPNLENKHVKKALNMLKVQGLAKNVGTKKKPKWIPLRHIENYEDGVVPDETEEEN